MTTSTVLRCNSCTSVAEKSQGWGGWWYVRISWKNEETGKWIETFVDICPKCQERPLKDIRPLGTWINDRS